MDSATKSAELLNCVSFQYKYIPNTYVTHSSEPTTEAQDTVRDSGPLRVSVGSSL